MPLPPVPAALPPVPFRSWPRGARPSASGPPSRCWARAADAAAAEAPAAEGCAGASTPPRVRALPLPSLLTLRVSRANVLLLLRCTLRAGGGVSRCAEGQEVGVGAGRAATTAAKRSDQCPLGARLTPMPCPHRRCCAWAPCRDGVRVGCCFASEVRLQEEREHSPHRLDRCCRRCRDRVKRTMKQLGLGATLLCPTWPHVGAGRG